MMDDLTSEDEVYVRNPSKGDAFPKGRQPEVIHHDDRPTQQSQRHPEVVHHDGPPTVVHHEQDAEVERCDEVGRGRGRALSVEGMGGGGGGGYM